VATAGSESEDEVIAVIALRNPEPGWPASDVPWYGIAGIFTTRELAEKFAIELRNRGKDTGRLGYADVKLCELTEIK
jgi:hypothetical protein